MLCCAMRLPYRLAICDTTRSDIIMALCCTKKLDGMSALRLLRNLKIHERFLSTSLPRFAEGSDDGGPPPKFMPPPKPVVIDKTLTESNLRKFLSPEFIPPRQRTDPFKFFMERKDMITRRKVLNIPEFYAGSILAVNMADAHASGKTNRFVGICTRRSGNGLGCTFVLRNIINGQGVEICYELYSPRIQQIDVLKLEKRLDDDIMYLRDALPEYSTVDPDMKPVDINPIGEVHINKLKVKMRPKPWSKRWERPKFKIQGINFALALTPEQMEHAQKWARPWVEYDFLREYDTSKLEVDILKEVQQEETKK